MAVMRKLSFPIGFACLLLSVFSASGEDNCVTKETALASLDVVDHLIAKANVLFPNCTDVGECQPKEKATSYLELARKIISDAKTNYPLCRDPNSKAESGDCSEVLRSGNNSSGVYTIWPKNTGKTFPVYCDMETGDGGWTVVQRRGNFTPQEDFYRTWNDYKFGFGSLTKDFWLGNDNLFALTNQGNYRIRFELESSDGEKAVAEYDMFRIEDEKANYKLHIGKYSKGNAGDSMLYHNGRSFSTKDKDQSPGLCVKTARGGWWYDACAESNLNGEYGPGKLEPYSFIYWYTWKEYFGLARTEIKIKIDS